MIDKPSLTCFVLPVIAANFPTTSGEAGVRRDACHMFDMRDAPTKETLREDFLGSFQRQFFTNEGVNNAKNATVQVDGVFF